MTVMQDVSLSTASSSNALHHRNATILHLHFKPTKRVLVNPRNPLNRLSLAPPNLILRGRNCQRTSSQTAQQRRQRQELFLLSTFLHVVGPYSPPSQVPVRASLTLFLAAKKVRLLFKAKIASLSPLNVISRNVDCFQVYVSLAPFSYYMDC